MEQHQMLQNLLKEKKNLSSTTAHALNSYRKVLYVGNLSQQVTRDVLYNLFIPFGEVLEVTVPVNQVNKEEKGFSGANTKHRGYAFVEFELPEDATDALENLNNGELFGRIITVNYSKATNLSREAFSDLNVPLWSLNESSESNNNNTESSSDSNEPNVAVLETEPSLKKTKLS
ncbi:predicted protein [Naegleria gruberi]|uniref:Predicted protein n=1 Tax=Naegleria gruberi TaxID=5762 RepID=D2VRL8_NAEGR|nr:uncharacterized protein NAEGRDRAFT_71631 [Naegleria gruberi]EFC40415.1 predicted protein [Naegleria gruberi]|eukprot:XP_002673159.1 predicted protein [Naegleria gruberi strain NEG-M]